MSRTSKVHDRRAKRRKTKRSLLLTLMGKEFQTCLDCRDHHYSWGGSHHSSPLTHRQKIQAARLPKEADVRASFNRLVRGKIAKMEKHGGLPRGSRFAKRAAIAAVNLEFGDVDEMFYNPFKRR